MRTKILTLVLLLFPIFSFGQNIEFMGMGLDTDFETFCKNLKTKGLTQKIDRFEEREYAGTFATYPNCRIIVKGSADRKKIQSVEVVFESVRNDKYDRDRAYTEILNQYKNKYVVGKVKEMEQDSATKMMNFVKHTITSGVMQIHIQKFGPTIFDDEECSMSIVYVNTSVPKTEKKDNYSSDI